MSDETNTVSPLARGPLIWRILFVQCKLPMIAMMLLAIFGLFHALGWRGDTAIISGTSSPTDASRMVIRGVLYALSYFAAVVISPILILTSIISGIFCRWM